MSLAAKVLIGLAGGVALGVFFGEQVAFLGLGGRAFVLLLQMAVLPFVAVSLVVGLGSLDSRGWRSLVRAACGFLVLIWAVTLLIVVAAPLAFPDWPAASYFNATLVAEHEEFDFLGLYIPANPFRALADGVVPAVVVFSLAFGLALMGSDRKQPLLEALRASQDALRRMTGAVVRLAPYGIFAIAAEGAGSMPAEKLAGVQVYLVIYALLSVFMAFWVLPALVAAVTPLRYRDVVGPSRDALVTAFATGSLFLVLPLVAERARAILAARGAGEAAQNQVDVVVPIAFTLAGAGKLLGLVFVLFAGWQSGYPISPVEFPAFMGIGLFSSFAGSAVSIPFMLDLFRIPADMFQLYLVVDSVIGGRFSAMTGAMHAFSLSLLAGAGAAAWIQAEPRRFAVWAVASLLSATAILGVSRAAFENIDVPYAGYRSFIQRSFSLPTVPWRDREETPAVPESSSQHALTRIRSRGLMRVGYAPDSLPYAFRNEAGELVGFDVEMAHALGRDLGVRVDFYRSNPDQFASLLDRGALDLVMTGLAITPKRLEGMNLSEPYLHETLAFIVRDHRRSEFSRRTRLQAAANLHIALLERGYYAEKIRAYLPNATLTTIASPRVFFRAEEGTFDAMAFAAEAGSAWTLIYPQFAVAVPHPDVLRVPVGYATARDDRRMAQFVDSWVALKRDDRTINRLFAHWFEGASPGGQTPRWSIARNVLGWGTQRELVEAIPTPPTAAPEAKPAPAKNALEAPTPSTPGGPTAAPEEPAATAAPAASALPGEDAPADAAASDNPRPAAAEPNGAGG